MKFSELSYREYLAIQFLPAFMRHYSALGESEDEVAENTAKYAFRYADAFLRIVGREDMRIQHAEAQAKKAETEVSVALLQIWEFLEVDNQASAMEALRNLEKDASSHGEEHTFRVGFSAGHQFGLGSFMPCNPYSEGANRAYKRFTDKSGD